MKRFGVIGHPIGHTLSPLLHNSAFSLLGLDCTYEAFDVDPASLSSAVHDFKARGFSGLNVTIPHKEAMLPLVDDLTEDAKAVGALNTVTFADNRLKGDNTDVYGVSASIESFRGDLQGQMALLLGAGGSARAITYALLRNFGCSEIVIANRNQERARELVAHFEQSAGDVSIKEISATENNLKHLIDRAALVINATPLGMSPWIDRSPVSDNTKFRPNQIVLDLIYTPPATKFITLAARCGARTISGLEMFLHQGARSFEVWLGRQMPLDKIRPLIVNELNAAHKSERQ
jgi:shikimate dehydrogenase